MLVAFLFVKDFLKSEIGFYNVKLLEPSTWTKQKTIILKGL